MPRWSQRIGSESVQAVAANARLHILLRLRRLRRSLMSQPPALTPDQRRAALEKAAVARQKRAEVKEQLKGGTLSLAQLFDQGDHDEMLGKLKVVSMLESLPGVGKVRARRLMEE